MFCRWVHSWLGITQYTWSGVTLTVHFCYEFCAINMDSPLLTCAREEQRAVIWVLWTEGVPSAEMHRRMSVQYGNSVVSQQIVYKWIKRFKNGHTSVKHEEGARHPTTSITDANKEWIHDMIVQNRWVTIDEVAHQLQISHGAACEIIHNSFPSMKGPKHLTELHKEKCSDICEWLLDRCGAEGDHFLEQIIAGDETWIHHYKP